MPYQEYDYYDRFMYKIKKMFLLHVVESDDKIWLFQNTVNKERRAMAMIYFNVDVRNFKLNSIHRPDFLRVS